MRIIKNPCFSTTLALVVMANAILIGISTQDGLRRSFEKVTTGIEPPRKVSVTASTAIEISFSVIFLFEIILRMCAYKLSFWVGPEAKWNMFDMCLVGSSVAERIFQASNFSFARILRLFRMVRMLRVLRMVPMFKGLQKMLISLCGCMLSLVWLTILMVLIIYVFAIGFMQAYLRELESGRLMLGKKLEDLDAMYGTVGQSMLTLFMTVSGGQDWKDAMDPIAAISPIHGCMFLFYIIFIFFGVLNVVTGVFVDRALETAQADKDFVVLEELQSRKSDMKDLTDFFTMLDHDRDGKLCRSDITIVDKDQWLEAYLASMDMTEGTLLEMFDILDCEDSGALTVSNFVEGCMRIRGSAKAIDLHATLLETRTRFLVIEDFMEFAAAHFETMEATLANALPQRKIDPRSLNLS